MYLLLAMYIYKLVFHVYTIPKRELINYFLTIAALFNGNGGALLLR